MSKKINYINRDFDGCRTDLITFIKQYYPEVMSDFNDASVGSVFIDMNAAVTDLLSYHTDRMFQETQLSYAQERSSILEMAKTLGVKIPGNRSSVTLLDFSVKVPVKGDSFDLDYTPFIKRGAQVSGNGHTFETSEDIDFSQPFSSQGVPNRIIIPNFDSNNTLVSYTLTKREIVKSGISKIFKRSIGINETLPFFNVILPDENVLSVESIIIKEGDYTINPGLNEFLEDSIRWYEMDSLVENSFFKEVDKTPNGLKIGKWKTTNNRYTTEYTNNGYMKITFGGGSPKTFEVEEIRINNDNEILVESLSNIISNNSLGNKLRSGTTLFVLYRVGGGDSSNVPSGVITGLTNITMNVNGSNSEFNSDVKRSLKVSNPLPAFGGRSKPTLEEIRSLIRYNYAAQNRAVTLKDYFALIGKMPGKFGAPFRYNVIEESNKIVINMITKDSENKLTSNIPSPLIDNITEYLSDFRMINDYVVAKSGKVINIGLDIDIMIQKNVSSSEVISEVIKVVTEYFNVGNFDMGDDIYISDLYEKINNVNGVLNILDVVFSNKFNGKYSNDISAFALPSEDRENNVYYFDLIENMTLTSEGNSMFEIKYPETDIRCRIK